MPLARAVVAGGGVADLMMDPDNEAKTARCYERLLHWFNMEADQAKTFLADVHKQAGEVQRLFDLPAGELGSADDILSRANEALERISLNATQKVAGLERDNAELKEAVNTDALTGVYNRRKFDADAAAAFDAATADRPLTVMFLDIDHFKQFNDTHGHASGDDVLKLFTKTLAEVGDSAGEVYRIGGEEFAMLFPGVDQKTAALIAERLRESVDLEVRVAGDDGEQHNVTTSIGVATYEGVFFKRIEQVVKAADRGVYAAKHAGRNCVRVFVPKPPKQSEAA